MPFGKPRTKKIRTDHLPAPIATCYRRIGTRHEPDGEKLDFVTDTAEMTARFLSAMALAMLRELAEAGRLPSPLIQLGDPGKRLKKPSFGLWMEILREGARRLLDCEELFEDEASRSLAGDLCSYVFNERGKTKGRPYDELDAILVIRNQKAHRSEALDTPALCEDAVELLHRALTPLDLFEECTTFVVKRIILRRRRLSDPGYEHEIFSLQGEIAADPQAETDDRTDRTWHTDTDDVLLYRGEDSYLNLDPLFVYVRPDGIKRGKKAELHPGMYCFNGFRSNSAGLVVKYMPCAGGQKEFDTSSDAFSRPEATEFLRRGVGELLDLLGRETP